MAKVKPVTGHIWGQEFHPYVCFSFRGNRSIFGWDMANSIFDLENSRSWSWSRPSPVVTFEAWSSIHVCFWFHSNCTIFSKFHNWPWNFKVKVMGEVKGQGVGLACHWCTYFSFLVNQANRSKDMVKWVFDPKKHIRNFGEKKIGKKSFHQNFSKI